MTAPYISAVITSLNEEHTIERFIEALDQALSDTGYEYEIIMVNDGSKDRTFEVTRRILQTKPKVRVAIDLMKNSGQTAAFTAGLGEATGRYVLMLDSDLQLVPADVGLLIKEVNAGADMVNGYRVARQDALDRKLYSKIANVIMRRMSGTQIRDFGCSFRLFDRRLIQAFNLGPEKTMSIPLLASRAGRIAEVPVRHRAREQGKSGWTFLKLWRYNSDNVMIMAEPIFQVVGVVMLLISFLLVLRVLLDPFLNWSLLRVVSNGLVLNAIVATSLAIIGLLCIVGEFLVRCHSSVLARPAYIIRERIEKTGKEVASD